jgi:hypothetical protein
MRFNSGFKGLKMPKMEEVVEWKVLVKSTFSLFLFVAEMYPTQSILVLANS